MPLGTDISVASAHGPAPVLARAIALCAPDLAQVEEELGSLLCSPIAKIPEVGRHLAFAGGKRLRPMLALLAAQATGFDEHSRITIAAVAELLHTATLLHDDVIDGGEFRRGRPAARVAFGNGIAVLTGDFCLARSVQAIAGTGHLRAVETAAATVTKMAEGEIAQLEAAGSANQGREGYYAVAERKTAALIAWCTEVAGLVPVPYRSALREYGLHVGFAFQIADDVLDYRRGDSPGAPGKEPGQDLREGKMTMPLILACEDDGALRERVATLLAAGPLADNAEVARIVATVADSPAVETAIAIAQRHADQAVAQLQVLPPSPARAALEAVAEAVVHRSR